MHSGFMETKISLISSMRCEKIRKNHTTNVGCTTTQNKTGIKKDNTIRILSRLLPNLGLPKNFG
jgi:hypothetical protein